MPNRYFSSAAYRYGFNGMEKDDEMKSNGNSYDFGFRQYDPRLGKFLSRDPFASKFGDISPYIFATDNPILFVDYNGGFRIPADVAKRNPQLVKAANAISNWVENTPIKTLMNDPLFANMLSVHPDFIQAFAEDASRERLRDIFTNGKGPILTDATPDEIRKPKTRQENGDLNAGETFGKTGFAKNGKKTESFVFISSDLLQLAGGNDVSDESPLYSLNDADVHALYHLILTLLHEGVHVRAKEVGIDEQDEGLELGEKWEKNVGEADLLIEVDKIMKVPDFVETKTKKLENSNGTRIKSNMKTNLSASTEKRRLKALGKPTEKTKKQKLEIKKANNKKSGGGSCGVRNLCCFAAGTKVLMANGKDKNIEEVQVGELIKTTNLKTFKIENKKVIEVTAPMHDDIINISFSDGQINTNTFDHSYYVKEKGWCSYKPKLTKERYGIDAKQLKLGDVIYELIDGKFVEVEIINIKENIGEIKTFNIFTEGNNANYFANGVIVHNESAVIE